MRKKKCKSCGEWFLPFNSMAKACSPKCAIEYVGNEKQRKDRALIKKKKAQLKTKQDYIKETEVAFRRYIRARDRVFYAEQGKPPECISCGTTNPNIQYAAGHYKTKGAYPELRFDELNCHLQCNKTCNKERSGNINGTKTSYGYTEGIKRRYGEEEGQKILDYLESHHPMPKWTIDDLTKMKKQYNTLANKLEKEYDSLPATISGGKSVDLTVLNKKD